MQPSSQRTPPANEIFHRSEPPRHQKDETTQQSHQRNGKLFFFKQKTAYEIQFGDWSSDVCSSDLNCSAAIGFRNRYEPTGV